jgi:hypothetical protein
LWSVASSLEYVGFILVASSLEYVGFILVGMLDTSGLPDFDQFDYQIARKRAGSCIFSWKKLREAERRVALCEWLGVDGDTEATRSHDWLMDSVAAFFYSFEASLQFLKAEFLRRDGAPPFDTWLTQQGQHDVVVRGLRTLRHLEAHIDCVPTTRHISLVVGEPDDAGDQQVTLASQLWKLHSLSVGDLRRLRHPKLETSELPAWEKQGVAPAPSQVMRCGLERVARIMDAAEHAICGLKRGPYFVNGPGQI